VSTLYNPLWCSRRKTGISELFSELFSELDSELVSELDSELDSEVVSELVSVLKKSFNYEKQFLF